MWLTSGNGIKIHKKRPVQADSFLSARIRAVFCGLWELWTGDMGTSYETIDFLKHQTVIVCSKSQILKVDFVEKICYSLQEELCLKLSSFEYHTAISEGFVYW